MWARLPKKGTTLEGLSRAYLYKLIGAGRVRSLSLAEPGAARGVRLIDLASLREYLAKAAAEAAETEVAK